MTIAGIVLFIIVCGFVVLDPNKNPIGVTLGVVTLLVVAVANRVAIWAWVISNFKKRFLTEGNANYLEKLPTQKTVRNFILKLILWTIFTTVLLGIVWITSANGGFGFPGYISEITRKLFYGLVGLTWILGSIDIINIKL